MRQVTGARLGWLGVYAGGRCCAAEDAPTLPMIECRLGTAAVTSIPGVAEPCACLRREHPKEGSVDLKVAVSALNRRSTARYSAGRRTGRAWQVRIAQRAFSRINAITPTSAGPARHRTLQSQSCGIPRMAGPADPIRRCARRRWSV